MDLLSTALAEYKHCEPESAPINGINSDRMGGRSRDKSVAMKGPPTANLGLKQLRLDGINNVRRTTQAGDFNVILISNSKVTLIQFHSKKGDTAGGQRSAVKERYCE